MDYAEQFSKISEAHDEATRGMLSSLKEMDETKDLMETAALQVEINVIDNAGGDEKKVDSTEASRRRTYELAKSKSSLYLNTRDHYYSARNSYKYHQAMVRRFDLWMQFLIATAKNSER